MTPIYRTILPGLLCLLSLGVLAAPDHHGGWKLESEKNGIKIYTRPIVGSKLKQVRAVTEIDASRQTVMHVLTDYSNYKNWVNNVVESYIVEHPQDSVHYVYTYEDAPWPVQNRYNVARMTLEEDQQTSRLSFQAMPHYMDNSRKGIEIERYEGWWEVSSLASGGCRIEYMLDHNPGGFVPPWLINYMAVDAPLKTLENLISTIKALHKS
ncbi:MAG: START domain-containing protein [Saprospiraceae bacterium]|nr:START domain-containing protein [Saprospiraceae bacterium]